MATTVLQPNNTQRALERYARAAHAAGVPRDQLRRFVGAGYVAQQHQLQFHAVCRAADHPDGPELIGFGGARGPGKTHASFAQVGLDDCQRFPGLKFLFLRRVQKAGRESFEDLRRKLFGTIEHTYRRQEGVIEFSNGSRIVLGHFKDEKDIDQYLGIEYDGAAIEEATTLTRAKLDVVRGSIRTSKAGWRPRMYLTTNPGSIGHQWFRALFVLPWRAGEETVTRFIPATASQNRYINTEYQRWLQGLEGVLGAMWRDGDWDVAGGAFFTNFDRARLVTQIDTIPEHWSLWLAMDYGFTHWNPIYLIGQDGDGDVHFIDSHAARRTLIPDHAAGLAALLDRHQVPAHRIQTFVAGRDVFAARHDGTTIASTWEQLGWTLKAAQDDRINGAAEWAARIGSASQPTTVHIDDRRCRRLLDTLPMLLSNPNRPEDVLKVDCDPDTGEGGDDDYDAGRYGLMEGRSIGRSILGYYQQVVSQRKQEAAHA